MLSNDNISKATRIIHQLEWLIQIDLMQRGIHRIPGNNLSTYCQGNLFRAIRLLAENVGRQIGIVTGFYIPAANPPAPENDGPPGALFIARGLTRLGYSVLLITDKPCLPLVQQGIEIFAHELSGVDLIEFPGPSDEADIYAKNFLLNHPQLTGLISIERAGPCHTLNLFLKQFPKPDERDIDNFRMIGPGELAGQPLNMRGDSIGAFTAPIHLLFEKENHLQNSIFTIGIGDGGNEIGMGSIPWQVIAENISNRLGGKIACRIPCDATVVAGVSNWAGYALMAGLCLYLNRVDDFIKLCSEQAETRLIATYFQTNSAVDGMLGYPAMSVDGINWRVHLAILDFITTIVKFGSGCLEFK